jgi:hypothetical protein
MYEFGQMARALSDTRQARIPAPGQLPNASARIPFDQFDRHRAYLTKTLGEVPAKME